VLTINGNPFPMFILLTACFMGAALISASKKR
jgi:hypothetical protein